MIGSKRIGLLGGGPPPKASKPPPPSSRLYKFWVAAQKAKEAQEEKNQKEREKRTQKTLNDLLYFKRGPPTASNDTPWEGSQASGPTFETEANQDLPVTLFNKGNTCFVNSGRTL